MMISKHIRLLSVAMMTDCTPSDPLFHTHI
jgi:hypothetical protein